MEPPRSARQVARDGAEPVGNFANRVAHAGVIHDRRETSHVGARLLNRAGHRSARHGAALGHGRACRSTARRHRAARCRAARSRPGTARHAARSHGRSGPGGTGEQAIDQRPDDGGHDHLTQALRHRAAKAFINAVLQPLAGLGGGSGALAHVVKDALDAVGTHPHGLLQVAHGAVHLGKCAGDTHQRGRGFVARRAKGALLFNDVAESCGRPRHLDAQLIEHVLHLARLGDAALVGRVEVAVVAGGVGGESLFPARRVNAVAGRSRPGLGGLVQREPQALEPRIGRDNAGRQALQRVDGPLAFACELAGRVGAGVLRDGLGAVLVGAAFHFDVRGLDAPLHFARGGLPGANHLLGQLVVRGRQGFFKLFLRLGIGEAERADLDAADVVLQPIGREAQRVGEVAHLLAHADERVGQGLAHLLVEFAIAGLVRPEQPALVELVIPPLEAGFAAEGALYAAVFQGAAKERLPEGGNGNRPEQPGSHGGHGSAHAAASRNAAQRSHGADARRRIAPSDSRAAPCASPHGAASGA